MYIERYYIIHSGKKHSWKLKMSKITWKPATMIYCLTKTETSQEWIANNSPFFFLNSSPFFFSTVFFVQEVNLQVVTPLCFFLVFIRKNTSFPGHSCESHCLELGTLGGENWSPSTWRTVPSPKWKRVVQTSTRNFSRQLLKKVLNP